MTIDETTVADNIDQRVMFVEKVNKPELLVDLLKDDDADRALASVSARGLHPESAVVRRSTLEDVFLRLTGRSLVE